MTDSVPSQSALSAAMAQNKTSLQFVGFRLADQDYAFRIEQIQEIVIPDRVTTLPQVPEYVEGVSNLRGSVIPIINLRLLFELEPKGRDDQTRTIVANVGSRTVGCTVDAVTQVMRIAPEQIQATPEIARSSESAYISGFAKLDNRLVILLEIDELLHPDKLDQVHREAARAQTPQT